MSGQGSGEGKRSWRQPDGDAAPAPVPIPGPDRPKRFHGGQSAVGAPSKHPVWFRLFVPAVGLLVIAVGLLILVLMLRMGSVRPVLVAWAVTDYQSPIIPLNEFAYRDVQKILKASAFKAREDVDAANLQTLGGFRNFFTGTLPTINDETLVVYVSAHGISRSDAGYILMSESEGDSESYYPVRSIIEHIAQCPARRKLLILDATRIGCAFELGLLGNDFVHHVQSDFKAVTQSLPEDQKQSFWIFLSSDAGQTAWASRSLGHSPFGITVAYALRGGEAVDAPNEKGRFDGYLTAEEVVRYTTDRVASWAPQYRDGAVQKPLCLRHGPDFRLIRVDQGLSEEGLLQEGVVAKEEKPAETAKEAPAPAAPAGSATTQPAAGATAAPAEAPSADEWVKTVENLEKSLKPIQEAYALATSTTERDESKLTDDVVLGGIIEFWKYREKLAGDLRGRRRPVEMNAFQHSLMRVEKLCLARQLKDAARILKEEVLPAAKSLARLPEGLAPPFTWSVVFANPAVKEDPLNASAASVTSAISDPTKVAGLQEKDGGLAEVGLLTALATEFTTPEKKWLDPDLVRFAIQTRQSAARASRFADPRLLPFLQVRLEEADRHRRAGERALVLRNTAAASQSLQQASAAYDDIAATAARLDAAFQTIERAAGQVVYYVRWLAADPQDREGRSEDIALLDTVVEDLKKLQGDASSESAIEAFSRACDRLDKQANAYAEDAWTRDRWRQTIAALEIPSLPATRRERLLKGLLKMKEETPFATNTRKESITSREWPANPVPLTALIGFLNGSPEIVADVKRLGPALNSELTLASMDANPEERSIRATAGERIRDLILERATQPPPLDATTPDSEVLSVDLRRRLLAPWRAHMVGSLIREDDMFTEIARRYVREILAWESARMLADDHALPGSPYKRAFEAVSTIARSLDPSMELANPTTGVVLDTPALLLVPADGLLKTTIRLKRSSAPRAGQNPRFVIDWSQDKERMSLKTADGTPPDGRLVVPLSDNPASGVWEISIELKRLGAVEPNPRLLNWIEDDAGRIDWLPIAVQFSKPEIRPAELIVQWPDRGDQPGVIEIYPNQRIPLQIAIRKGVPGPLPVRIEFQCGTAIPVEQRMNLTAEMSGEIPLAILKPVQMPLERSELNIRLYHESTLLDERKLEVKVIDVTQAFQPAQVVIDSERGVLSATVKRIVRADTDGAVPISLSFADDQVGGVADIAAGADEARTECPLPEIPSDGTVAQLAIAEVPRAFRFRVSGNSSSPPPMDQPGLEIRSPRHLAVYRFSTQRSSLPVQLKVDAPGKFIGDLSVRVGVDADGNSDFDAGETVREIDNAGGRTVVLALSMNPEGAVVELSAQMTDIRHDLRAPWVGNRKQTIRAELSAGNRTLEKSVDIFLLQNVPKIVVEEPAADAKITLGKPVRVTVSKGDDLSEAIDTLEFGFDKDMDGKWDEDESVAPLQAGSDGRSRFDSSGVVRTQLPTEKLAAGQLFVMVRARVAFEPEPGKEPEIKTGEIIKRGITLQEVMAAAAEKPTTGTIKGVVVIGSQPVAKADVTIANVGATKTDDSGRFTFTKVPPGTHTIVAKSTQQLPREGQAEVTVEAGKEQSVEVSVRFKPPASQ